MIFRLLILSLHSTSFIFATDPDQADSETTTQDTSVLPLNRAPDPEPAESGTKQDTLVPEDYAGVMALAKDSSENANLQRYVLQKALIHNEPILAASLRSALANLTSMYQQLQVSNGLANKQTLVINADASAGGLLATSRSLYSEIPATHKLVQKVVDSLTKTLASDARAINQSLSNTVQDFQAQIQSQADSVSALLAQQDRSFALRAMAQQKAMIAASGQMQRRALAEARDLSMNVNETQKKLFRLSKSIKAFSNSTSVSLDKLSALPASLQSQLSASASKVKENVQSSIIASQSDAEKRIQTGSDTTLLGVENAGAQLSRQLLKELNRTQANLTHGLAAIDADTTARANEISGAIRRGSSKATLAISNGVTSALKVLSNVQSGGNTVAGDAAQVAQDTSSMLSQLGTKTAIIQNGFQASMGKLQADVPSQMQAALGRMLSGEAGLNADLIQELLNENGGVAYLGQFTDQELNKLGIQLDGRLALSRRALANRGFAVKNSVQDLSSSLGQNLRQAEQNAAQASGSSQSALAALAGTMGISIEDLSSAIKETASSANNNWDQLKSSLASSNSAALETVMTQVRAVTDEGNKDLREFVSGPMASASSSTRAELNRTGALILDLLKRQAATVQSHDSLVAGAGSDHSKRMRALRILAESLQAAAGRNMGTAKLIRANMQSGIAEMQSRFTQQAAREAQDSESQASSALAVVKKLFGTLNSTFSGQQKSVAGAIFGVGANLDAASLQLSELATSSATSSTALASAAYSILAGVKQRETHDFAAIDQKLSALESGFLIKMKHNATLAVENALAGVINTLNRTDQGQIAAGTFLSSLQNALDRVQADLSTAHKASEAEDADFKNKIGSAKINLFRANREVNADMQETIDLFRSRLREKEFTLNQTAANLSAQLNLLNQMVLGAQNRLGQDLVTYQARIDGVVAQIRAYMNLSSHADELAISNGISKQLASVNSSQVRTASDRAGLERRMTEMFSRNNRTQSRSLDLLVDLGAAALGVANGSEEAKISLMNSLTAVGGDVDGSASQIRKSILGNKNYMSHLLHNDSVWVSKQLADENREQKARFASITDSSSEVTRQSRRSFLDNLKKLGWLNDGLNLTSSQLQALILKSNRSVTNISDAARGHFQLASSTLNALRAGDADKVASVSDVMAAFAVVVVKFLSETESAMRAVMKEMNFIDASAQTKLRGVQARTKDEVSYINSALNRSSDQFRFSLEQDRAVQQELVAALQDSRRKLALEKRREKADIDNLVSQISEVEIQIKTNSQAQLSRVREYIQSRSRQY